MYTETACAIPLFSPSVVNLNLSRKLPRRAPVLVRSCVSRDDSQRRYAGRRERATAVPRRARAIRIERRRFDVSRRRVSLRERVLKTPNIYERARTRVRQKRKVARGRESRRLSTSASVQIVATTSSRIAREFNPNREGNFPFSARKIREKGWGRERV